MIAIGQSGDMHRSVRDLPICERCGFRHAASDESGSDWASWITATGELPSGRELDDAPICGICIDRIEAENAAEAAIEAARDAVSAIPVTDATVSARAKALRALDDLIDERAAS